MINVLAIPIPARSGAIYLASSTPEARQMSAHAEAVGMVGGAKAEGAKHTKLIDVVSCVYLCYVCPVSFSHTVLLFSLGIDRTALQGQEGGVSGVHPETHVEGRSRQWCGEGHNGSCDGAKTKIVCV